MKYTAASEVNVKFLNEAGLFKNLDAWMAQINQDAKEDNLGSIEELDVKFHYRTGSEDKTLLLTAEFDI